MANFDRASSGVSADVHHLDLPLNGLRGWLGMRCNHIDTGRRQNRCAAQHQQTRGRPLALRTEEYPGLGDHLPSDIFRLMKQNADLTLLAWGLRGLKYLRLRFTCANQLWPFFFSRRAPFPTFGRAATAARPSVPVITVRGLSRSLRSSTLATRLTVISISATVSSISLSSAYLARMAYDFSSTPAKYSRLGFCSARRRFSPRTARSRPLSSLRRNSF